jgi:hypothetical protein
MYIWRKTRDIGTTTRYRTISHLHADHGIKRSLTVVDRGPLRPCQPYNQVTTQSVSKHSLDRLTDMHASAALYRKISQESTTSTWVSTSYLARLQHKIKRGTAVPIPWYAASYQRYSLRFRSSSHPISAERSNTRTPL